MTFAPQGTITYPGIKSVLSGNFSLTTGGTPGVCMLSVAPQPLWSPKIGTLAIDYSNVHLRFRGCTIDRVESRTDSGGHTTWSVAILDRRWKWRGLGKISGYYNVRRDTASNHPLEIVGGTEMSPRDLAKLCFKEIDETGYDISQMPNRPRPAIEWDYATPIEAMVRLCEEIGCLITLNADDRSVICRNNIGQPLPYTPTVLSGGSEVDPPERPDSIVVVTAPARVQQDLELEAVGDDVGYETKPIDKLSYKPSGGWAKSHPPWFFSVDNPGRQKLAAESVFRKYRIKTPFRFKGELIGSLDRILPLLSEQVLERDIQGRKEPRPPEVFGRFFDWDMASLKDEAAEDEDLPEGVEEPNKPYTKSFSVDANTGIVTFSEPVYRDILGADGLPIAIQPARLWLRIAFNVRVAETRGWHRAEYKTKTEGVKGDTNPAYFLHDDLVPKLWNVGNDWEDNHVKIRRQAEYYRDGHLNNYLILQSQTYEYAGFAKLSPDGAVSNVTWTLSGEGFATTRAVRGKDDLLATPTYKERRLWERLAEEHRRAAKTEAEQAQRQARGRRMNAYNRGSLVTRNDVAKEITETVPPFSFVTIGRSGDQAASRERHQAMVWEVGKPGCSAPLYRPELIAVNGPLPIAHKRYGQITQDWPARVAILSEDLPDVHGSVGISDDNWLAVPGGGLFTVLGADPVFLRENGATQDATGQWINLPKKVLLWITPRGESRPWGQGWGLTNTLPTVESLDFLLEQPLQSRLQQPYQGDSPETTRLFEPADHITLWEPVLDEDDHAQDEDEEGLPIKRAIEWVQVREAGTYLIQFGGMIAKTDFDIGDSVIGIGLFGAAWNEDTEEFELYDQPAAIASRLPFSTSIQLDAIIGGTYEFEIDTLLVRSQENVTASAIVELKAGWAFGFLKFGRTSVLIEHFQWSAYKLGPASDPDQFWAANAGKVDWAGDDHSPVDL